MRRACRSLRKDNASVDQAVFIAVGEVYNAHKRPTSVEYRAWC